MTNKIQEKVLIELEREFRYCSGNYKTKKAISLTLAEVEEERKEEIEFLEAITKWHSWERMSKFAQANIKNRIEDLKQKCHT